MCWIFCLLVPIFAAAVQVGFGKTGITPTIGTLSAGYSDRKGKGMEDIHDPLLAIALYLESILSFGGKHYGERVEALGFSLLEAVCE